MRIKRALSARRKRFLVLPLEGLRTIAAIFLSVACFLFFARASAQTPETYRLATPGYRYSFPHDYFNHPDFQTEWWYYTGNLQSADGHRFGFELTFFRQAIDRDPTRELSWDMHDLYFAHLALSDLGGTRFYHTERTNRAGPAIAGVDETTQRIWNGNWQVQWKDSDQLLQAVAENFDLRFTLHSGKAAVIQGENGVSQKAAGVGHASHYISLTHLATKGTITLNGKIFEVSGLSWMDHEFFTQQLSPEQTGWDWLSIQLQNGSELMLFQIHSKDGSVDPFSAGTYVDPRGQTTHLRKEDFVLQPAGETWKSPVSGAVYPVDWKIAVAKLQISLEAKTLLPAQELKSNSAFSPTYWEGAVDFTGQHGGAPITGSGYLEMTGYAKASD